MSRPTGGHKTSVSQRCQGSGDSVKYFVPDGVVLSRRKWLIRGAFPHLGDQYREEFATSRNTAAAYSDQLEAGDVAQLVEILRHQLHEFLCHRRQVLPMPEGPADGNRRQVRDENGLDCAGLLEIVSVHGRRNGLAEIELDKDPGRIKVVEYNFGFQMHALLERSLFDGAVVCGRARQAQIADSFDVLQRDAFVFGERVGFCDEQKQSLMREGLLIDAPDGIARRHKAQVGLTQPQYLQAASTGVGGQEA